MGVSSDAPVANPVTPEIGGIADEGFQQTARGSVEDPLVNEDPWASTQEIGSGSPADRSATESDIKVKVWSERAGDWRYVFAKSVENSVRDGDPKRGDQRAWTSYCQIG